GDDGGQHENDWRAELATDGERHHYGMKAGQFYIDGVPVTMTNSSGGREIGDHPSVTGTAQILYAFVIPSGSHVELADVRLFTMSSDVAAQAGYDSTLLDDGATTIVGAWLMADGSGNPADRSVKNSPLTLETGMTWEP
ncbi:MAG: hypothetical protein MUP86_02740, partial [Dehalococcoidia bacterium]|nr:hypothetical protein [Dehalococcoidia bacterium]